MRKKPKRFNPDDQYRKESIVLLFCCLILLSIGFLIWGVVSIR